MPIFYKILLLALGLALLPAASASESLYDRDYARGFISLKGDFRSMKSTGVKFINEATHINGSYNKQYVDGHVDIGAEYNQFLTWFDIDFLPITLEREGTEWYTYGLTWMWGYKLFPANSIANIIPSIGPGFELLNIRNSPYQKVISCIGPTLNLELELRLQASQFSFGVYGGYKVVRHDGWDELSKATADPWPYESEVNADKVFVGAKISWTMLSNHQKREKEITEDSQSKESNAKVGIRVGYNTYRFSWGDSEADKRTKMGKVGFGGGLVGRMPLGSKVSLNPELDFYYRNLLSMEVNANGDKVYESEFALGIIPFMLQFTPAESVPFYLAAGFQLDIPISPEAIDDNLFGSDSNDLDNRESIDFGIPFGLGYMITPNFGVDFRYVLGLTHLFEEEKKSSLMQFGLGFTYLF